MSKVLDILKNEYFEWLCGLVGNNNKPKGVSYRKLLMQLHNTEFRYSIKRDQNRADDGIDLRYRFALTREYEYSTELVLDVLEGPCSVLEMMIALANRCEQTIMDDPNIGDRTGQWFWGMVRNLGLGAMLDSRYDKALVRDTLERLLNREYEPDGTGGLFRIRDCDRDLRTVEIWYQLCWYLDSIV